MTRRFTVCFQFRVRLGLHLSDVNVSFSKKGPTNQVNSRTAKSAYIANGLSLAEKSIIDCSFLFVEFTALVPPP